jgi:hypothetical protein
MRSFAPEIATVLVGRGGQMPARQMFLLGFFAVHEWLHLLSFTPASKSFCSATQSTERARKNIPL